MRLRHVLPVAAALALVGCNGQPASKTEGAARTAISSPPAAPACPTTPAPACPPAKSAKSAQAARGHAVRRAAVHRRAKPSAQRVATASGHKHGWRRYGDLAGGPPEPGEGRDYARVPPDYAWRHDDGGSGYRYGPAYPAAPRYDDRRYEDRRYDERRDDDRRHHEDRDHRGRYDQAPDDRAPPPSGYYYRHGGEGRSPDRYSSGSSSSERHSSSESGGSRVQGGYSRGGSAYDYDHDEGRSASGYRERRSYRGGRSYRSEARSLESSSSTEHRTWGGGCCASSVGAAGFDGAGFLTWPGKVPARP